MNQQEIEQLEVCDICEEIILLSEEQDDGTYICLSCLSMQDDLDIINNS